MMEPGMVAVVRGLQDTGLCVTLLDGARQYTLVPNAAVPQVSAYPQPTQSPVQHQHRADHHEITRCDTGSQAVDGNYTTSYKMAHCYLTPTSPPVQLTEFPPQRAEVYPGHGNFEIGGCGSGENHSPTRANVSYRGGMSWPDRGTVRTPRPSQEPDAFASSLRKYPSMSPERSAEVVERLINYTQLNNSKNLSPRPECVQSSSRAARPRYKSEGIRKAIDDPEPSPTGRAEYTGVYGRSYDVRFERDISRRMKENVKNITYPYSHPVCPTIKERYDHLPPELKLSGLNASHSANMETQAEILMVSKEVTTMPRDKPSMRNVAVPLSASSSTSDTKPEKSIKAKCSSKSIQTKAVDLVLKTRKSVQTCFSSADILESKIVKNNRKSKSQEELRQTYDLEDEIVQIIHSLAPCPNFDRANALRSKILRKLIKLHKDRSESMNIEIGRCIKDELYSKIDLKNFTKELSNELISKLKQHSLYVGNNPTSVYRADLNSFRKHHENNCVEAIIKEWLKDIPIQSVYYLDKDSQKEHSIDAITTKITNVIVDKLKYNSLSTIKSNIIEIIEDIPIDVAGYNKRFYLNRFVSVLIRKVEAIYSFSCSKGRLRKAKEFSQLQPTEKVFNHFIKVELNEFTKKFNLKMSPETLKQIETEVSDILISSPELIKLEKYEEVKHEIIELLANFDNVSEHQATCFANSIILNLKDIYRQSNNICKPRPQTFIILQNSVQNNQLETKNTNTNFSIEDISERDIDANLDLYTKQIIEQITEWSSNIECFDKIDVKFKQVVINDLASDIVDRHKYLELNPTCKKTDIDELEHLKYQIFKWMNKVVGEDNLEMINHASDLMEKLKSIPVPMLTKLQHNSKSKHLCCQTISDMPGSSKLETVESTAKAERLSSPDHFKFQSNASFEPCVTPNGNTIMTGKQFMNRQRRQSSHGAISIPENPCCKREQNAKQIEADDIEESKYILKAASTDVPPNYPDETQNRIRQPEDDSVSTTYTPRNRPLSRRISGMPECPRLMGVKNVTQTPNSFASTPRLSNPARTNKPICCTETSNKATLESPTVKQLNDEYDEFLKHWVQEIPIAASNTEEQALAKKARLGIYNGIWKAITKLKMNPAMLSNPFYYQDVFDDEIEELLSCLPQSQELVRKKPILKSQLIEKTTNTNQLIINASEASSFKQQLVENVSNNLPRDKIDYTGKNMAKLYEDMQKMNLAEDFIMYVKYREADRVKANVYKKKLMKEIQELIHIIKRSHGKELKDIDAAVYIDEIISALHKVPLPSEETIREEADEIAIGHEIKQWFSDLPLVPNDDYIEQLGRRRYKASLTKKIYDIGKQCSVAEYDSQVRAAVKRFLQRMPLRPDQAINIHFMAEELLNRLKNRPSGILTSGEERKNYVAFTDAFDYDEFSRDMPICSSFSDSDKPAQANQRSFMIVGGNIVQDTDYIGAQCDQSIGTTEESQQQWYSLDETRTPRPKTPSQAEALPSCCPSYKIGKTSTPHGGTMDEPITQSTSSQTPKPMILQEPTECAQENISYEQSRFNNSRAFVPGRHLQPFQQASRTSTLDNGSDTDFPGPDFELPRNYKASCKGRRYSAPASYREASTRPMQSSQIPDQQCNPNKLPSVDYYEPISFTTPNSGYPPISSRPKKNMREVEKSNRDVARQRLELEESDIDTEEEVRCRCMEKFWRCRRRKHPTCEENDIPCFIRFPPHPYFY